MTTFIASLGASIGKTCTDGRLRYLHQIQQWKYRRSLKCDWKCEGSVSVRVVTCHPWLSQRQSSRITVEPSSMIIKEKKKFKQAKKMRKRWWERNLWLVVKFLNWKILERSSEVGGTSFLNEKKFVFTNFNGEFVICEWIVYAKEKILKMGKWWKRLKKSFILGREKVIK